MSVHAIASTITTAAKIQDITEKGFVTLVTIKFKKNILTPKPEIITCNKRIHLSPTDNAILLL